MNILQNPKPLLAALFIAIVGVSLASCQDEPQRGGTISGGTTNTTPVDIDDPADVQPLYPTDPSNPSGKVIVAYVTSWTSVLPDPSLMTHINYAFGHVNNRHNGVRIDNESRLRNLVQLKDKNPDLKVMLSIGGWGSGGFSEMAANETNRKAFAQDCRRVVDEYGLDGIDIDWEYPTSSAAGISSSPADRNNYTQLMRDLREALGKDLLLTLASSADAAYYDFRAIEPCVDFVNIMAYDMANAPQHHSALYRTEGIAGWVTGDEAVKAHINKGMPARKLVLGMPFYARGSFDGNTPSGYISYKDYASKVKSSSRTKWSQAARVPYLIDINNRLILGFENRKSIRLKCEYVMENNLLGAMYWEYGDDNASADLANTVRKHIPR